MANIGAYAARSTVLKHARELARSGQYESHRTVLAALHATGVRDAAVLLRDRSLLGQIDRLCEMTRQGALRKRSA